MPFQFSKLRTYHFPIHPCCNNSRLINLQMKYVSLLYPWNNFSAGFLQQCVKDFLYNFDIYQHLVRILSGNLLGLIMKCIGNQVSVIKQSRFDLTFFASSFTLCCLFLLSFFLSISYLKAKNMRPIKTRGRVLQPSSLLAAVLVTRCTFFAPESLALYAPFPKTT